MSGLCVKDGVCQIVGAAPIKKLPLKRLPDDMIIAADGGFMTLKKHNIIPDVTIGDFDSCDVVPTGEILRLNPEKDITDTARAVQYGRDAGYSRFMIYGGIGCRTSHTLANIQLMSDMAKSGERCLLIGDDECMAVIHDSCIEFDRDSSGYVSVFSLDDKSCGVSESGLKYTISDYEMTNTYPLGVSNEFIGKPSRISVENGTLLIIFNHDTADIKRFD